eukprot:gene25260-biopygen15015
MRIFLDVCGNLYLARKNQHTSARRRPGENKSAHVRRPPTPRKKSAHVRRPPVPRKKSAHVRRPRPPLKKTAHVPAGRLREKREKKHMITSSSHLFAKDLLTTPRTKAHVRRQAGRHREKKHMSVVRPAGRAKKTPHTSAGRRPREKNPRTSAQRRPREKNPHTSLAAGGAPAGNVCLFVLAKITT